ncbi:MAG: C13 family peptidase [Thermodesulfobacteriota bacterium]|nr:C13 family peptidase [Thermodesulfobacteriota bacterium]
MGFTFKALGGGTEVLPGRGPLIILAAGDANPDINSTWNDTRKIVKIVYNGFVNAMDYTDDDIFLIMGQSSIDIDDDGAEDPGVVDHSQMTKTVVSAAMEDFVRQRYKEGETLYLWIIGHGGHDERTAQFKLAQSQGEYLDDLALDTLLTRFQIDQKCDSMVIFIETCFAGSFNRQLDGDGRKIVMAAEDRFVHWGQNGEFFSSLLIDRLKIPWSLGKAFKDVKVTMKNRASFIKQKPRLDADGDGTATWSERDLVNDFYVGGISATAARPPSIISHTSGGRLTGESIVFEIKANSLNAFDSAWASIVRPDFDPEEIAAYFTGEKETYEQQVELVNMKESADEKGKFTGIWRNYDIDGSYEVIFHVRDAKGMTSASDPVIFRKGNTPFVRPDTDKSIYGASDQIEMKLSLGGKRRGRYLRRAPLSGRNHSSPNP